MLDFMYKRWDIDAEGWNLTKKEVLGIKFVNEK